MRRLRQYQSFSLTVAATCCLVPLARAETGNASAQEPWIQELAQASDATREPGLGPALEALRQGTFAKADEAARAFVKDHPGSLPAIELIAIAALARGDLMTARSAATATQQHDSQRAISKALLGQVAFLAGDPAEAEMWFRHALEQAPSLRMAHRGRTLVLMKQGQLKEAQQAAQEWVKHSLSDSAEGKYMLAKIDHELGQHEEAEGLLQEVLSQQPEFQEALLLQGIVKLDLKKFTEAATLLNRVIARDPKLPWARLGMSVIHRMDGDLARARAELAQLVREQPGWALAHFALGETLIDQGAVDAALAEFSKSVEWASNPPLTRLRIAAILLKYGQSEPTLNQIKQAVAQSPALAAAAVPLRIQALTMQGRRNEAEQTLQNLVNATPKEALWLTALGRFYLSGGRPVEALEQFKKAQQLNPRVVEPLAAEVEVEVALNHKRAAIAAAIKLRALQRNTPEAEVFVGTVYDRLGETTRAEKIYRDVLKRAPTHVGAQRALASVYARTKRVAQAVQLLENAAQAYPEAVLPLMDLAEIQAQQGMIDEATSAYHQALKRHPDDPLVLNNLACLLGRAGRQLDVALSMAERAFRLAPASAQVDDTLGWIVYLRGDLDRAAVLLTRAVAMAPDDPQIHYHLGMVYLKQDKPNLARAELSTALRAKDFPEAAKATAALELLH